MIAAERKERRLSADGSCVSRFFLGRDYRGQRNRIVPSDDASLPPEMATAPIPSIGDAIEWIYSTVKCLMSMRLPVRFSSKTAFTLAPTFTFFGSVLSRKWGIAVSAPSSLMKP